jgi:hypothetical protein
MKTSKGWHRMYLRCALKVITFFTKYEQKELLKRLGNFWEMPLFRHCWSSFPKWTHWMLIKATSIRNIGLKWKMFIALMQHTQGLRERVRAPVKNVFGHPSNCGPAERLYTKSETLTLSCRVTWAETERVHLYSRQLLILPRKTKTYATYSDPGPPSGPPGPGNFHRLPPPHPPWYWAYIMLTS